MNIHRRVLEDRGWKFQKGAFTGEWNFTKPNGENAELVNCETFEIACSFGAPAADANFAEELLREMGEMCPDISFDNGEWRVSLRGGSRVFYGSTLCEAVEKLYLKFKGIEL
jgi:hypothetical protein